MEVCCVANTSWCRKDETSWCRRDDGAHLLLLLAEAAAGRLGSPGAGAGDLPDGDVGS